MYYVLEYYICSTELGGTYFCNSLFKQNWLILITYISLFLWSMFNTYILPNTIRAAESVAIFKNRLNTHPFYLLPSILQICHLLYLHSIHLLTACFIKKLTFCILFYSFYFIYYTINKKQKRSLTLAWSILFFFYYIIAFLQRGCTLLFWGLTTVDFFFFDALNRVRNSGNTLV